MKAPEIFVRPPLTGAALLLPIQAVALVAMGAAIAGSWGFPLDDAWIHQVVGRNLAEYASYGFTPNETSSGSTSLSWTLILATNFALFGADPVAFALLINSLFFVAAGQFVFAAARADGIPLTGALLLAGSMSLVGNFAFFVFSGMEVMSLCALGAASIATAFGVSPAARRTAPVAGTLLVLTRPEALALIPLLFVALRWLEKRPWRHVLSVVVPPVVAWCAAAAANLILLGTVLPTTFAGRRWLFGLEEGVSFAKIGRFLELWRHGLASQTLGLESPAVWYGALALIVFALVRLAVGRRRRTCTWVAWAAAHFAIYCLLMPASGHAGRYQPLTPVLFASLSIYGVWEAATALATRLARRWPSPTWRWTIPLLTTAPLLGLVAMSLPRWAAHLRSGIDQINHMHREIAFWVRTLPAEANVAAFDIGALGFFSGRRILDLGGLVDRDYLPYLRSGRVAEYLVQRDISHVVLPVGPGPTDFRRHLQLWPNPSVKLFEIARRQTPISDWALTFDAIQHASPAQIVYRLESTRVVPGGGRVDPAVPAR